MSARRGKTPKKITESYLHNAGLHYLQRFATGTENFRRVMMRKVERSCRAHPDLSREDCTRMVEELIGKFVRSGLLDDGSYAAAAVASLRRRGESARAIEARLAAKGLNRDNIRAALRSHGGDDINAALRFARRRRLGPFAAGKTREHDKQMAAFARAGYGYELAARILALSPDEARRTLEEPLS